MNCIDERTLNPLERHIHEVLLSHKEHANSLRIGQAAEACQCSVSKISKFVKKLGFNNYKQYMDFIAGKDLVGVSATNEIQRIRHFLESFDPKLVEELSELIERHAKILLFGYGPSLLCCEYFAYRFCNCTDKTTMAISDPVSVANMADASSLLIILTETGKFHSFKDVYENAKKKGCEVVIIVEEFTAELLEQCDRLFYLASQKQPQHLKAYEKSRTAFFIFLEEVIQRFLNSR